MAKLLQQVWQETINYNRGILIIALLCFLASCKARQTGQFCSNSYDQSYQGNVHVGESYKVNGKTYLPKIDHQYDEIGLASWYGGGFHCKKTANGEVFNKYDYSAAHTTLPLPSVVKVTNLSNNKSTEVIVNDRGPFTGSRIIDLSEKAAHAIGMKHQGIARVRVQFLPDQTNELMSKISSKKKIYYGDKPAFGKFAIIVESYKVQTVALQTIKKLSKYGEIHLIHYKNLFTVLIISNSRAQADLLVKKLKRFGYNNARINNE